MPPTVPVLLQILSGAKSASDLLPKGSIYALEPNKSVELLIPGGVLGGPVSILFQAVISHPLREFVSPASHSFTWCKYHMSKLRTYTEIYENSTRSRSCAVPGVLPTTLTIPSAVTSSASERKALTRRPSAFSLIIQDPGSSIGESRFVFTITQFDIAQPHRLASHCVSSSFVGSHVYLHLY